MQRWLVIISAMLMPFTAAQADPPTKSEIIAALSAGRTDYAWSQYVQAFGKYARFLDAAQAVHPNDPEVAVAIDEFLGQSQLLAEQIARAHHSSAPDAISVMGGDNVLDESKYRKELRNNQELRQTFLLQIYKLRRAQGNLILIDGNTKLATLLLKDEDTDFRFRAAELIVEYPKLAKKLDTESAANLLSILRTNVRGASPTTSKVTDVINAIDAGSEGAFTQALRKNICENHWTTIRELIALNDSGESIIPLLFRSDAKDLTVAQNLSKDTDGQRIILAAFSNALGEPNPMMYEQMYVWVKGLEAAESIALENQPALRAVIKGLRNQSEPIPWRHGGALSAGTAFDLSKHLVGKLDTRRARTYYRCGNFLVGVLRGFAGRSTHPLPPIAD